MKLMATSMEKNLLHMYFQYLSNSSTDKPISKQLKLN